MKMFGGFTIKDGKLAMDHRAPLVPMTSSPPAKKAKTARKPSQRTRLLECEERLNAQDEELSSMRQTIATLVSNMRESQRIVTQLAEKDLAERCNELEQRLKNAHVGAYTNSPPPGGPPVSPPRPQFPPGPVIPPPPPIQQITAGPPHTIFGDLHFEEPLYDVSVPSEDLHGVFEGSENAEQPLPEWYSEDYVTDGYSSPFNSGDIHF